jgi:hypothetical protein
MRQCSVKTEEPFWRHSHKLPAGTCDEKKLSLAAQRTSTSSTTCEQFKLDTKMIQRAMTYCFVSYEPRQGATTLRRRIYCIIESYAGGISLSNPSSLGIRPASWCCTTPEPSPLTSWCIARSGHRWSSASISFIACPDDESGRGLCQSTCDIGLVFATCGCCAGPGCTSGEPIFCWELDGV